jgi:hypothetical protein
LSVVNNSAGPDTPGPTVSRIAHLRDGAIGISEGAFGDHPGQQPQHLVADLLRQALPQTARHRQIEQTERKLTWGSYSQSAQVGSPLLQS